LYLSILKITSVQPKSQAASVQPKSQASNTALLVHPLANHTVKTSDCLL